MKTVLVTGAAGFIGRHCLPLLAGRGHAVHAVVRERRIPSLPGVEEHRADLLDPRQVTTLMEAVRPSHLLHLAWYTAPGRYPAALENVPWVAASLGVLQAFLHTGGRRAVMAGTCLEYGPEGGTCSEQTTPRAPTTLYGVCKHALQTILARAGTEAGISTAWGRVFFLYGPHEHPARLVPSVARSLLRGAEARCSPGDPVRDFLFVEDVAGAFAALLDSEVQGPVNIASGRPIAVKNMVQLLATLIGRPDLLRLGALPAAAGEPPRLVADVTRLGAELGWRPRFTLEGGLQRTVDWWRAVLAEEAHEPPNR